MWHMTLCDHYKHKILCKSLPLMIISLLCVRQVHLQPQTLNGEVHAAHSFPDPGASSVPTVRAFKLTFFCFSLLPLKHLLLWRQSLLQELHVELILLLHFLLLPEAHLVAYVALEAEAQRDHRVANTAEMDRSSFSPITWHHSLYVLTKKKTLHSSLRWLIDTIFPWNDSSAQCWHKTVAHQCAAKGRHKSTWKFFRSLNLMAASMYTKSIHRETVGRQTPLSEKGKNKAGGRF